MVATISRDELKAKIDRGDDFVLVEALGEEKYRDWHLPGAINIPYNRVRELAPQLLPDKNADIVVYCGIDVVQLSGEEPWEYCERLTRPVLKVVKVRPGDTAESLIASIEAGAEYLLRRGGICIIEPYVRQRYGGTGQSMDWELAAQVAEAVPVMLAGGLTPANVGEAVQRVRPWGVDVSSGVETGQRKDEAKIAAFIAAARGTSVASA